MTKKNTFNKFAQVAAIALPATVLSAFNAYADPADPGTYYDHTVAANGVRIYWEYLYGDEETLITLDGYCRNANYDIDLWVYDSNGNQVGKATSSGCYEQVSIVPAWSDDFKIVVENKGKPYRTKYDLSVY